MGDPVVLTTFRHGCSRRRIKRKIQPYCFVNYESIIPDEIIIDILSRLPAKEVLVCRCVCRRWRDLTSGRYFIDMQIRRHRRYPMFFNDPYLYNGTMFLFDRRCSEPPGPRIKSKIHRIYKPSCQEYSILFSHQGLIVAIGGEKKGYIIYNPIYPDVVNIAAPVKTSLYDVYGVFFHPVHKELCSLWRIILSFEPLKVQYKILNLESKPMWRDIRNPCTQISRIYRITPVLTDKHLYWIIKPYQNFSTVHNYHDSILDCDIMEYDITNEEFRVIPCPVPIILEHGREFNVNLIVIDGVVTLVQVFPSKESVKVNLWTLNGGGGHDLLWACSNYIVSSQVCSGGNRVPKAIAFWNGELVFHSKYGKLYFCNLKQGTCREFGQKYMRASHLTSLVSLKNCKSKTIMVEDDDDDRE